MKEDDYFTTHKELSHEPWFNSYVNPLLFVLSLVLVILMLTQAVTFTGFAVAQTINFSGAGIIICAVSILTLLLYKFKVMQ